MTKNEILSVLKFYRFHNKFFPMPIFLDIGKKQKEDIKNIAIKIREETKKKTDFICKL